MPVSQPQKLTPHFLFTFPGKIWKIKPDFKTQQLVLETRQPELLQASFSVIDTQTGELFLNNYQTPERWWTGLEAAQNGLIFLHGYAPAKDTGRHLGITAINASDGSRVWHEETLTFFGINTSETLVAEDASGQLWQLELKTGERKKYSQIKEHAKTEIQAFELSSSQHFQVPVPYLPQDAYFPMLQEFIAQQTGRQAEQALEYLETNNHILISYYARVKNSLANFLCVCSAQGELLLDICLEAKVPGLGSDTFFIFAQKLFFIQEKTSLACFLL